METFLSNRLPSQRQALLLFIASAFVINIWSIINLLRWMPSLLGNLAFPSVLVVVAYAQTFALIESFVVFLFLALIGFLAPKRFLRNNGVAKGTVFLFITALWTISYHYLSPILLAWKKGLEAFNQIIGSPLSEGQLIILGMGVFIFLWIVGYIFLLVWSASKIRTSEIFVQRIHTFLERLSVLTAVYIALDALAGIFILIRIMTL